MVVVVVKESGTDDGIGEEDVEWKGKDVGPGRVQFWLWVGH